MNRRSFLRDALIAVAATTALARTTLAVVNGAPAETPKVAPPDQWQGVDWGEARSFTVSVTVRRNDGEHLTFSEWKIVDPQDAERIGVAAADRLASLEDRSGE